MGPELRDKTKSLRAYLKKSADSSKYNSDLAAQEARQWLLDQVLTECVIVNPNLDAAARPWQSVLLKLILVQAMKAGVLLYVNARNREAHLAE